MREKKHNWNKLATTKFRNTMNELIREKGRERTYFKNYFKNFIQYLNYFKLDLKK